MGFTFQFKHKIKGIQKLYFDEIFGLLSEDERNFLNQQFLINNFSGNSLNKLLDINLRYDSNVEEIRVSDEHFLFWSKGALGYCTITIIPLLEIEHCYYSEHINNINTFYFGFIFKNGKKQEFNFIHNKQLCSAFEKLHKIIDNSRLQFNGFTNEKTERYVFTCPKGSYSINENQLYFTTKKTLFKKETTQLLIPNIQNIIWCYQWHNNDDNVDFHTLSLYLLNSQKPVDIHFGSSSASAVFDVVLAFKKIVPHILYGPSSEYETIYRENSEELMALAKSRLRN